MILPSEYGYLTASGRGVAATVVGAMLAFVALAPSSAQPVVTDRISTATVFWPLHLIGVAAGHTA